MVGWRVGAHVRPRARRRRCLLRHLLAPFRRAVAAEWTAAAEAVAERGARCAPLPPPRLRLLRATPASRHQRRVACDPNCDSQPMARPVACMTHGRSCCANLNLPTGGSRVLGLGRVEPRRLSARPTRRSRFGRAGASSPRAASCAQWKFPPYRRCEREHGHERERAAWDTTLVYASLWSFV